MHFGKAGMRVYFCRNSEHAKEMPSAVAKLGLREDVAIEAVPCSGRIDSRYILKAFEGGAKAVCIIACPTGTCKMLEGNLRASRRVHAARALLIEAGLDPDSVRIFVPGSLEENTVESAMEVIAGTAKANHEMVDEVLV